MSLHFSAVSPQTLPKKSKEFGERTVRETKRENKQAMRAFKVADSSYIFRSVIKEIRDSKVAKVVRLYRGQSYGTQRVLMQQYLVEQFTKRK